MDPGLLAMKVRPEAKNGGSGTSELALMQANRLGGAMSGAPVQGRGAIARTSDAPQKCF